MGLLDGKVAAITGAGNGIGRAHALLFAAEGARVVVNDLGGARDGAGGDGGAAARVVEEITSAGGQAIANTEDAADPVGAEAIVAHAIEELGQLDIMVSNAGILRDKTLLKMDVAMWDDVLRVHLTGTFLCMRAAARHMRERNQGGRIITTTSVSGLLGNFGQANYAAAKAGIYGLTRTAALELRRYGITVNTLAPVAHTRMTEDLPMMSAMADAESLLAPDMIAPAALFLASDGAAEITGQVVGVEGNRIFLYKMEKTGAVLPAAGSWSAGEIAERWEEISGA